MRPPGTEHPPRAILAVHEGDHLNHLVRRSSHLAELLLQCSRGAQRVLRYGDMEYVMLHLIFIYLMPGEGQPAAYAASDL